MSVQRLLGALATACSLLVVWSPMPASGASFTLQTANNNTGNQAWSGVGVRFDVNSPISVSALGIFDSDQNGIAAGPLTPLTADLYLLTAPLVDPSVGVLVASQTFDSTSPGTLDARYRFKSITPLILVPGRYVLAGYGWTAADLEHNCNITGVCETFNNGGGVLTYIDSPYGGSADPPGTIPTNLTGTNNHFSAANMQFTPVPEPSTWLLFATIGVGVLVGYRRWGAA